MKQIFQSNNRDDGVESWIFWAFMALLLWIPLPLGSNRAWSWSVMEVGIFMLLSLWGGLRLIDYFRHHTRWSFSQSVGHDRTAVILLIVATIYPLWQTIPWPEPLLAILSATTLEIRQIANVATSFGPITQDLHATQVEWLKGIAYLGAFWLTLVLTPTRQQIKYLLWVLLASGTIQVVVALATMDPRLIEDVNGTYVNRNHLAGLLELLLPLSLAILYHGRSRASSSHATWLEKLLGGLQFVSGFKGVVTGLAVAMFLTLFLTQSRSGNASLLLALMVVYLLTRIRRYRNGQANNGQAEKHSNRTGHDSKRLDSKRLDSKRSGSKRSGSKRSGSRKSSAGSRWSQFLTRSILLAAFVMVSLWMGVDHLMERYLSTNFQQEERWLVSTTALDIIADYPVFGSGCGTFAFTYPLYQHESLAIVFYDHAHNDHLEFLAERGLVGYGLLAAGVSLCWFSMARAYLRRRDPFACALLSASLVATLSLLLHGLVDFNFQIPANALYFMVMLALGLRATVVRATGHRSFA